MPYAPAHERMKVAAAGLQRKRDAEERVRSRVNNTVPAFLEKAAEHSVQRPDKPVKLHPNPVDQMWEPIVPKRETKAMSEYSSGVRRVVEAEIDQLMEWGLPRFQVRFPRAREETIRPMLVLACRGGKLCFLRTDNAAAIFVATVTPEEPELSVYEYLLASRISVPDEVAKLYRSGLKWAVSVGACSYTVGTSTGASIQKYMEQLGREFGEPVHNHTYTFLLKKGMQVEDLDNAAE
jgi:hypothetical protein